MINNTIMKTISNTIKELAEALELFFVLLAYEEDWGDLIDEY